jgi:TonB family protein
MNRTRCLSLVIPALLAGCASTAAVPGESLLTSEPRSGQQMRERSCGVAAEPAHLPTPGDLVEVPAFQAAVERVWESAGRPDGYILFSVRHSSDGVQVRRAVLESTLPAELDDTLQKLVFAHRRQAPAAREEWGVRMRLDLGHEMAIRVGRRETCTPRPRAWEYRTAGSMFDARTSEPWEEGAASFTDPAVVWVHVRLDERGTVTDARVERSLARPLAEQTLLNYVRSMAFLPATEDGYPVPGELTLPVRLSMTN